MKPTHESFKLHSIHLENFIKRIRFFDSALNFILDVPVFELYGSYIGQFEVQFL